MFLQPAVLAGNVVRLEPLSASHLDALAGVALHPELWRWTALTIGTRHDLEQAADDAWKAQEAGSALPFVIIDVQSNQVAGWTRYMNADAAHRRLEIGHTFVAPQWQRTRVNTEAKYLLLEYAFEELNCIRVEFKTDVLNTTSRAAIERLGAIQEGILRSHMVMGGGRLRDTVYYSILASEWPAVAARLRDKLNRSEKLSS